MQKPQTTMLGSKSTLSYSLSYLSVAFKLCDISWSSCYPFSITRMEVTWREFLVCLLVLFPVRRVGWGTCLCTLVERHMAVLLPNSLCPHSFPGIHFCYHPSSSSCIQLPCIHICKYVTLKHSNVILLYVSFFGLLFPVSISEIAPLSFPISLILF